jgi:hypothetical protein
LLVPRDIEPRMQHSIGRMAFEPATSEYNFHAAMQRDVLIGEGPDIHEAQQQLGKQRHKITRSTARLGQTCLTTPRRRCGKFVEFPLDWRIPSAVRPRDDFRARP